MLEFDAGSRIDDGGLSVVLEVEHRGIPGKVDTYWANVKMSGSYRPSTGEFPTFSVEITLKEDTVANGPLPVAWQTDLLPIEGSRDIRMGKEIAGSIRAARIGGGLYIPTTEQGTIALQLAVAVEALGAEFERYTPEAGGGTYVGARIGSLAFKAGVGYQITEKIAVMATLGMGGSLSLGSSDGKFSVHKESENYLRLSAIVAKAWELYVEGAIRNSSDSGFDFDRTVFEATTGIRFIR